MRLLLVLNHPFTIIRLALASREATALPKLSVMADLVGIVTIESLLDEVETLLSFAENPEKPPRPDLSLPTDYCKNELHGRNVPHDIMVLKDNGVKGRGWFAKEDIAAGTVLVCEKPLAMVMDWQDPSLVEIDDEGLDNFEKDPENLEMQEHESGLSKLNEVLLLELLRKISLDVSLWTEKISHLFPRTEDDLEGLDLWDCIDESIFCQFEQFMEDLDVTALAADEIEEIRQRLPLVIRYNVLSAETSPELMVHPSPQGYSALSGTALYYLPSFFNHDCQPNASRFAIGDIIWIVANQDIKAGQEVCISYLEHEVLCEPAEIRTSMLNMDFAEPEQDGQDEIGGEGPYEPVVDADVQNELMQMDPMQRLPALDGLIQQALGEAVPEEEENDIAGAPWFECDVQNLRILKALTLDSMGRVEDALLLWEACVCFAETKLPPNDESAVVVHVQTALCAFQCGETKKSKVHAARALVIHDTLFGGGVARFRRRYQKEFQLALRPTFIHGATDALWPITLPVEGRSGTMP